jgi:uncharacterized membrane protein YphA (DoxX/SURF4 family)
MSLAPYKTQRNLNSVNEGEVMNTERVTIEEPRIARLVFSDIRFAWLWLPLRLYLGYMWFEAGWHKFTDPKWMGTGEALLEYWKRGLKMAPKPAISYDWYRGFIEYLVNAEAHTWFAKIIIFGELAIAAGLILGAFVGIAAFFGGMMNWSFIMAGSRPPTVCCSRSPPGSSWRGAMRDGSVSIAGCCRRWGLRGNLDGCFHVRRTASAS